MTCFCGQPTPEELPDGRFACRRCGDILTPEPPAPAAPTGEVPDADPLLAQVREWARANDANPGNIQRVFRVGYIRARRLIDELKKG